MTRRAITFTPADYATAIKGAVKGGMPVGTFKIVVEDGRLTILPIPPSAPPFANDEGGSWVDLAGETQDHGRA